MGRHVRTPNYRSLIVTLIEPCKGTLGTLYYAFERQGSLLWVGEDLVSSRDALKALLPGAGLGLWGFVV